MHIPKKSPHRLRFLHLIPGSSFGTPQHLIPLQLRDKSPHRLRFLHLIPRASFGTSQYLIPLRHENSSQHRLHFSRLTLYTLEPLSDHHSARLNTHNDFTLICIIMLRPYRHGLGKASDQTDWLLQWRFSPPTSQCAGWMIS